MTWDIDDIEVLADPDPDATYEEPEWLAAQRAEFAAFLTGAERDFGTPDTEHDDDTVDPPAAVTTIEPLTVRWVTDSIANPPSEPPALVDGLIREAELVAVAAPRAVGKSWLSMNLAALLSDGTGMFLGTLPIKAKCNVLIAQGELDPWGTYTRWKMLTGDDAPPAGVAETFDRWRVRIVKRKTHAADTHGQNWTEEHYDAVLDPRLEETIRRHNIKVLVIDPWAVYFAGSENSNDEVEAALDKLRDLAMRTGCAVVIVHHISGKGSIEKLEPEDMWRGATRLADWASTRVTLLPHWRQEGGKTGWKAAGKSRLDARRYLDVHILRRSGRPVPDFSVVFGQDPATGRFGWWSRWEPDPEQGPDPTQVGRYSPDDVAERMRATGGQWVSRRAAAEALGCSPETALKALERAAHAGVVERFTGARNAVGYRLPVASLLDKDDPGPTPPPDDDEMF